MKLVSTFSWTEIATGIKLCAGFVVLKIIAVIIGPSGVAIVGQFSNLTQIIMAMSIGGIGSGVIKYTSQLKDNHNELHKMWQAIPWISGCLMLPVIVFMLIFHNYLAIEFLHDPQYGVIFIFFSFSLIFYVANNLILSILNGLHEIKKFNILNMLNSIIVLVVTMVLVYYYKVFGALLALVISQSITFFIIVFFVVKSSWFKISSFFGKLDKYYCKKLLGFTLMSIVSACVNPTSQMFVRSYLANHTSWSVAGCWQGMQKISDAYLMIIYAALGTYYLPKLANLTNTNEIKQEIRNGYKLIIPFLLFSTLIIYFLRDFEIKLLFSDSFTAMRDMFFWQLLGDCFKISSWILAYLMIAKAKTKLFVITEIIFGITFPLFACLFISYLGSNGAVLAFAVNYALYLMLFIFLYKRGLLI